MEVEVFQELRLAERGADDGGAVAVRYGAEAEESEDENVVGVEAAVAVDCALFAVARIGTRSGAFAGGCEGHGA